MTYPRIRATQNLDKDLSWAGPTAVMVAGENLVFGEAVYIGNDGKVWKAKADSAATMPCAALAVGSISADDIGEFLLFQFLRDDSWSWVIGGSLYVDKTTAGVLTQIEPGDTGAQVQVVGKAIATNIIYFSPEAILAGGGGDMFKSVYDPNADGVVKDSDKLEGSTKAQVQDHTPKAHTLGSHSTKAHTELTGVTSDQHHAKVHGDTEHTKSYIEGSEVPTHETDPNVDATLKGVTKAEVQDHTPKAHTLASHSTKAHAELSDAPPNAHHPQSHNAVSHSDISSSGADIDDAVAKKHAQAHTLASHTTKAHSELTGVTANQHHTKYTDAEAKAAAVQSGAITNGVTKAPTHDAVYDVKVTADTATTPAEVDAKITTHKGDASAHHAKYTNTEAQSTVKANVEVGDLKAPTKALAMNSQKITGLLAPTATGDALRKGTRVTITELPAMTDEKIWKGTGGNVEEVDMPTGEAGEGHITILPFNYNSIGQGTWALVDGAGAYWGEWQWRNTTNANADNITYKVYLAEGTYTLALLVAKHGNAPIVDVDIAGVEKASFDLYAAVQANNTRVTQTAIAMTAGLKDLRIRVDGKHGSSGGYQFNLQAIALWRTA